MRGVDEDPKSVGEHTELSLENGIRGRPTTRRNVSKFVVGIENIDHTSICFVSMREM